MQDLSQPLFSSAMVSTGSPDAVQTAADPNSPSAIAYEIVDVKRVSSGNATCFEYSLQLPTERPSCDLRQIRSDDSKIPARITHRGWSSLVVALAFLDWFHIAFNLINLDVIRSTSVDKNDAWHARNPEIRICANICIFIYIVRCVAQPIVICWGACRASQSDTVKAPPGSVQDVRRLTVAANAALRDYGDNHPIYKEIHGEVLRATLSSPEPEVSPEPEAITSAENANISARERLEHIFNDKDKEKLNEVASLLKEWQGNEDGLFESLEMKYYGVFQGPYYSSDPQTRNSTVHYEADATAVWNRQDKWFTIMTFNTFLMLPAMLFVQNPYKDHAYNVRDSYIKLGSRGKKDYYAGIVLLLMVCKKTLVCNAWHIDLPISCLATILS